MLSLPRFLTADYFRSIRMLYRFENKQITKYMEDKLVTLAIRTFQRAQMIKSVLDENGIETVIHNLNLEQPEMAVGTCAVYCRCDHAVIFLSRHSMEYQ